MNDRPGLSRSMAIVSAVNNEAVLHRDLLASPLLAEGRVPAYLYRHATSIGTAYNAGIDASDADILIFAHQDVYIPRGWERKLGQAIERLQAEGVPWAVLGCIGISTENEITGRVWSSGAAKEYAYAEASPRQAISLDELLLVVRRASGLRFDENLPGFHLYGTDIVQEAIEAGLPSFVIDTPVVHNSRPLTDLDTGYRRAFRYMSRKWRRKLPFRTPTCTLSRFGIGMQRIRGRILYRRLAGGLRRRQTPRPVENPGALAARLGYETQAYAHPGDASP